MSSAAYSPDDDNIEAAIDALIMTQCPYYKDPNHGVCMEPGGTCWQVGEPRCQTGEPVGGWVAEALSFLTDPE